MAWTTAIYITAGKATADLCDPYNIWLAFFMLEKAGSYNGLTG